MKFAPHFEKYRDRKLDILTADYDSIEVSLPPKDLSHTTTMELDEIEAIVKEAKLPKTLLKVADKDPVRLFTAAAKKYKLDPLEQEAKEISEDWNTIAFYFKDKFKRRRPYEILKEHDKEFPINRTSSSESPSYPSGHSMQGYGLAEFYKEKYPYLSEEWDNIADIMAHSRLQLGVHFPSDNKASKSIVEQVVEQQKTASERLRTTIFGVDPEGKLLHGFGGKGFYKFPGGGVDPGESITDAAKRELLEEAGYDVDSIEELPGLDTTDAVGASSAKGHMGHGSSRTKYLLARLGKRNESLLGSEGDAISNLQTAPLAEVLQGLEGDMLFGSGVAESNYTALNKLRDILSKTASDKPEAQDAIYNKLKPLLPEGTHHVSGGLPDAKGLSDVDIYLPTSNHTGLLHKLPEGTFISKTSPAKTIYTIPGLGREVNLYATLDPRKDESILHRKTLLSLAEQFPELEELAYKAKASGLKSEPAWAKVLGLTGDPYELMKDTDSMLDTAKQVSKNVLRRIKKGSAKEQLRDSLITGRSGLSIKNELLTKVAIYAAMRKGLGRAASNLSKSVSRSSKAIKPRVPRPPVQLPPNREYYQVLEASNNPIKGGISDKSLGRVQQSFDSASANLHSLPNQGATFRRPPAHKQVLDAVMDPKGFVVGHTPNNSGLLGDVVRAGDEARGAMDLVNTFGNAIDNPAALGILEAGSSLVTIPTLNPSRYLRRVSKLHKMPNKTREMSELSEMAGADLGLGVDARSIYRAETLQKLPASEYAAAQQTQKVQGLLETPILDRAVGSDVLVTGAENTNRFSQRLKSVHETIRNELPMSARSGREYAQLEKNVAGTHLEKTYSNLFEQLPYQGAAARQDFINKALKHKNPVIRQRAVLAQRAFEQNLPASEYYATMGRTRVSGGNYPLSDMESFADQVRSRYTKTSSAKDILRDILSKTAEEQPLLRHRSTLLIRDPETGKILAANNREDSRFDGISPYFFPGGGLYADEYSSPRTPTEEEIIEGARREALEELGIGLDNPSVIGSTELLLPEYKEKALAFRGAPYIGKREHYVLADKGKEDSSLYNVEGDAFTKGDYYDPQTLYESLERYGRGDDSHAALNAGQAKAIKEHLLNKNASDLSVLTAVPTQNLDLIMRKGLYSQKAMLEDPEIMAAFLAQRNADKAWKNDEQYDENRFREQYDKRIELMEGRDDPLAGPSVFFTEPDPDKVSDPRHFINKFDTQKLRVNLAKLLQDIPETRIQGAELIPFPDNAMSMSDEEWEPIAKQRQRDLSPEEVAKYIGTDPKELWKHYPEESIGKHYAANVPHAFIRTPSGIIPPEYLEQVEKTSSIDLLTGRMGAGKSTLLNKIRDQYDIVEGTDLGSVVDGKFVEPTSEDKPRLRQEKADRLLAAHHAGKRVLMEGYPPGLFRIPGMVEAADRAVILEPDLIQRLTQIGNRSKERGTSVEEDIRYAVSPEHSSKEQKYLDMLSEAIGGTHVAPTSQDAEAYLLGKQVEKTSSAKEQLKHVLVTGHSGAGKTTYARQLAEQLGIPLHRLDVTTGPIMESEYPEYWDKGTLGYPEDVSSRVIQQALALDKPHVIEGSHILELPELTDGYNRILIDTPEDRVVEQRAQREYRNQGRKGKPYRPIEKHREAAEELANHYRDIVNNFRSQPGVESIVPEVKTSEAKRLYHGSPLDLEELELRVPPHHTGKGEAGEAGVYAADNPVAAALYALARNKSKGSWGVTKDNRLVMKDYKELNPEGYVYELDSKDYNAPPEDHPALGYAVKDPSIIGKRKVTKADIADYIDRVASKEEFMKALNLSKQASLEAEFLPDFTPDDLSQMGVYDQVYGDAPSEASMKEWPEHWINKQDPLGWLQWYDRYSKGRRTEDDTRQMKRWKSFKARHLAQYLKNPTLKRKAALRNWAIDVEK